MNRRIFIQSLLALAAVPAIVQAVKAQDLPILYGDGKHNDREGLQALYDGKQVQRPDGTIISGAVPPGHYYFEGTLHASAKAKLHSKAGFRTSFTLSQ